MQAAIDAHSQNSQKWKQLYSWFQDAFAGDVVRGDVAGKLLNQDKQLGNRAGELARLNPQYIVLTAADEVDLDDVRRFLAQATLPRAESGTASSGHEGH